MFKIYCSTTACPFCGAECGNHPSLIAHMIKCAASRMPGGNGHGRIVAVILALLLALAPMLPAKAQTPQPTPTVGGGPQVAVQHKLFLPFISIDDGVGGQGRYWGGMAEYVSWCPSCSPRSK